MADERDPRLVGILEGRIRVVFGSADVIVGRKDFHERYEVRGEPGPAGTRPLITHIPDMWLRDESFDKIDRRLRQFPLGNRA
jgi:hypothetical protein